MSRSGRHAARWAFVARACARKAYSEFRLIRRGLMYVEDEGVLVFYDNALPHESLLARERAVDRFRARLADAGVRVLATATHPRGGPDDGLSLAAVLGAGEDDAEAVTRAWARACDEELFQQRDGP